MRLLRKTPIGRHLCAGLVLVLFSPLLWARGATFVVTNTASSGAGSLSQAITSANNSPGTDTITFNIPGTGVQTISNNLPALTDSVLIDGSTQPGFSGLPMINLLAGLTINSSNCALNALAIGATNGSLGVAINSPGGSNAVTGCFIGTGPFGTNYLGLTAPAIYINNSCSNQIGGVTAAARNLLWAASNGVVMEVWASTSASNNVIQGNWIGVDVTGTNLLPGASGVGIELEINASNNIIGGVLPGAGNVVDGTTQNGIEFNGNCGSNVLAGNYVGVDATGKHGLGNTFGVSLNYGASGNLVESNLISGNTYYALEIAGNYSPPTGGGNVVIANKVGTDKTGMFAIPNGSGIFVFSGSSNQIGAIGMGNLVSGNSGEGIEVQPGPYTQIQGNWIGVNAAGGGPMGNGGDGVFIVSDLVQLGGGVAGQGNIISGNQGYGVYFYGGNSNVIQGNYIGTDVTGGTAMGNTYDGISLDGSYDTLIGGTNASQGNVIAGNGTEGICIGRYASVTNLTIIGNLVGVAAPVAGNFGSVAAAMPAPLHSPRVGYPYTVMCVPFDNTYYSYPLYLNSTETTCPPAPQNYIADNVFACCDNSAVSCPNGSGCTFSGNTLIVPPGVQPILNPGSPPVPTMTLNTDEQLGIGVSGTPNSAMSTTIYGVSPLGSLDEYDPLENNTINTGPGGTGTWTVDPTQPPLAGNGPFSCGFTDPCGNLSQCCTPTSVAPVSSGGFPGTTVANHLWSGNSGCPVATFTGELYEAPGPDLVLGGPMPLRFRRYYAAWIKRDGFISGRLGDNWLHNFEMLLIPATNNLVEVVTQFGRVIQFTNNAGGGYALVGRMDVPYQLVGTGTNYVLGDPFSQRLYTFDTGGKLTQIADGRGNAHTLAYSGGLLAGVSDGLGHSLSFLYNSSGQLTNVRDGVRSVSFTQTGTVLTQSTDALGNPTTYSYDSSQAVSALMTSRTQPEGNVPFFQVFDSSGRVASQIEAGVMPGTNTFTYTTSNSTSIADPFTFSWRDNYSALGDLTNTTDPTGHFLSMAYNTNGQRISVTDRLGYTTLLGYHPPSGKMSAFTNSDGNFVTFTYSSHKAAGMTFYDLASINYPDGTSEKASYDAQGNLLSQTDRAGQVTTYSYNSRGQVLAATNPVGGVITLTYNADGTMATRTDSDIGTTSYFYDQFRRLTNTVNSDATSSQTAYDAADRIISATDEMGRKFTFTFDRNGNRRQLTDPGGNSSFFGYDPRNRLLAVTNRLGEVTTFSYDQRGLMTTNVSPTGDVTSFAYDSRRRPAVATDPVGNAWQTSYDNEDLLAAATNPSSQTSTLTRNSMGQITNTADPLLETVNLARDPMQRITQALDPLSRSNNFSYDPRGILSGAARQGLGAALYQYNPLGLISGITDLNSNLWTFAYTPMGRPQSVTDPLGRTRSFLYDIRGRLQIISYPDGTTCSNAYDPTGNPVAVEYSAGPNVQYTYDALNRMTSTSDLGFSYDAESRLTNTASSGVNFGASYDASGRLIGATYFNGAFSVVYAYDRRGLLTNVSDTLTGAKVSFFYDISDRLISVTRANGVNGAYGYDAAGRLTSLQEGTFINLQFGLDPAGEITNQTLAAPLDPSTLLAPSFQDFAYDPADQIAGGGYAYDHRGRLTASPGHKYTWDGASRLAGIDAVTMTYNGLNQLLTRTQNGATVRYFYNRAIGFAPIMAERNESTLQIQRYYVWAPGGRLLYLIDPTHGNAVSYFHFDQVGSTLALTTAAGAVSDSYAYTPNGALLGHAGSSTQPFAFIGEFGVRTEPAAGLCDMRARYYDPLSARFLTPDSLWPRLSRPDALDPYQYALRNPFRYIDPAGKCEFGGGNALAGGALVLDTFAGGLIFAGNNAQTAANLANAEAATIAAKGANELFDMYEGYCNGTIAEEAGNGSLAFETYTEEAALDLVNGTYGGTPGNPFAPGAGKNAIFSPQAEIQAKKWWYSNLGEEVETLETEGAQLSQRASTLRAVGTGLAVVGITVQTGVAVYQDIHNGAGVVVTVTDAASTISANAAIMAAPPWPPWISSPAAPSPVAFITPS